MERQRRPTNIAGELMTQRIPEEESERSVTAQIQAIRPVTKNNKTYQVLEFVPVTGGPPHTVNVFNPHQVENLQTGMTVDITLVRKNNFWNLGTVKKSDQAVKVLPTPLADENRPSENPTRATVAPRYNPRDLDPREYRIMSMNALTNAVNFVTSFKEILKPTNIDEAFAQVDYYRTMMIEMHDPNYGSNRTGESK